VLRATGKCQPIKRFPTGDAFLAQLNGTGAALVYSTYLGGSDNDWGGGIAVKIPEDSPTGNVPIAVRIGNATSQAGLTVSVR
jgi:hypothetical protein